jgi:serine/threonine-protein kinase
MVTGRVPFEATTPSDVMRKHLKEPLIPPDHINTALSAGCSEVIEMMLAKNKNDRYASAEELLTDLEAVRRGEPPLAARRKFNLEDLEQLQNGKSIEPDEEVIDQQANISRYKVLVVILSSVIAVLVLLVVFLFASK